MSKTLNISVLVAARDEYIEQLKCILTPLILQGFNSIYKDALAITEGKRVLYKFQELLKEIPKWNQTILQEESKRIKKKCPYIMDIVTAIFVSNVKILASIRLKGKNENIRVKIPTSDIFIHSIYIETGQQIFYDPILFYHKTNTLQQNKKIIVEIIRLSIDETVRQMLPFDNILQEYLANALNDNADNESDSDSEDGSGSDSDEDSIHGDKIINDLELESSGSDYDDPEESIKKINLDKYGHNIPQESENNGNNINGTINGTVNGTINGTNLDSDSDSGSDTDTELISENIPTNPLPVHTSYEAISQNGGQFSQPPSQLSSQQPSQQSSQLPLSFHPPNQQPSQQPSHQPSHQPSQQSSQAPNNYSFF